MRSGRLEQVAELLDLRPALLTAFFLFSLVGGCADICEPGATQLCYCSLTSQGVQICESTGSAWGACSCEAGPDAALGGLDSAIRVDAGSDGHASIDATIDGSPTTDSGAIDQGADSVFDGSADVSVDAPVVAVDAASDAAGDFSVDAGFDSGAVADVGGSGNTDSGVIISSPGTCICNDRWCWHGICPPFEEYTHVHRFNGTKRLYVTGGPRFFGRFTHTPLDFDGAKWTLPWPDREFYSFGSSPTGGLWATSDRGLEERLGGGGWVLRRPPHETVGKRDPVERGVYFAPLLDTSGVFAAVLFSNEVPFYWSELGVFSAGAWDYSHGSFPVVSFLWASSPNELVAAGTGSGVRHYSPAGGWVTGVLSIPSGSDFYDLWGLSSDALYLATEAGLQRYAGNNIWLPVVPSPSDAFSDSKIGTPKAIGGSSEDNFFVAGTEALGRFDGTTWTTMNIPEYDPNARTWRMTGYESDNIYLWRRDEILRFNGSRWSSIVRRPLWDGHGGLAVTWGTSSGLRFAAAHDGTLFVYDSNSDTWSTTPVTSAIRGLWGLGNTVFAVGDEGAVWRYNGSSWNQMAGSTTERLNAVWASSIDNVYAAGTNSTVVRFNGTQWQAIASPPSGATTELTMLAGYDENYVVTAVGSILFEFNGTGWKAAAGPGSGDIGDDGDGGLLGPSPQQLYLTQGSMLYRYDGSAWVTVSNRGGSLWWANSPTDIYLNGGHFDGLRWTSIRNFQTDSIYSDNGRIGAAWGTPDSMWFVGSTALTLENP